MSSRPDDLGHYFRSKIFDLKLWISAISQNSAIFSISYSINSNSAILNWARFFWIHFNLLEDPLYVECRASPRLLGWLVKTSWWVTFKKILVLQCSGTGFFYQSMYYEDHGNWDPNNRGLAATLTCCTKIHFAKWQKHLLLIIVV